MKYLKYVLICSLFLSVNSFAQYEEDQRLIDQAAKKQIENKPIKTTTNSKFLPYQPGFQEKEVQLMFNSKSNAYDKALQRYERSKRRGERIKDNEVKVLANADEARIIPRRIEQTGIFYPIDWPQKSAKRAKYKDGVIARSEGRIDPETGKEWYTAIYDISDLLHVAPNFRYNSVEDRIRSMRNSYSYGSQYGSRSGYDSVSRNGLDIGHNAGHNQSEGHSSGFNVNFPNQVNKERDEERKLERERRHKEVIDMIKSFVPQPEGAFIK